MYLIYMGIVLVWCVNVYCVCVKSKWTAKLTCSIWTKFSDIESMKPINKLPFLRVIIGGRQFVPQLSNKGSTGFKTWNTDMLIHAYPCKQSQWSSLSLIFQHFILQRPQRSHNNRPSSYWWIIITLAYFFSFFYLPPAWTIWLSIQRIGTPIACCTNTRWIVWSCVCHEL